jgi:hypothetical protein
MFPVRPPRFSQINHVDVAVPGKRARSVHARGYLHLFITGTSSRSYNLLCIFPFRVTPLTCLANVQHIASRNLVQCRLTSRPRVGLGDALEDFAA